MKKNYLDELQLHMAMKLCKNDALKLLNTYSKGSKALSDYEKVQTQPEKALFAKPEINLIYQNANEVIRIICRIQRKTGCKIIRHYMNTKEQKMEFMEDLDDFFNKLMARG